MTTNYNAITKQELTPRRLCAVLPKINTAAPIYTCPVGHRAVITLMEFVNTGGGAGTVRVHHVVTGETAAASNALYYDLSISRANTVTDDDPRFLDQGDAIYALQGTADFIAVTLYGYEVAV